MKIFVHLGLHKTGSTFLQHVFDASHDWLLAQGVLVPRTGLGHSFTIRAKDSHSGHQILGQAFSRKPTVFGDVLAQELLNEIGETAPDVVFLGSETWLEPGADISPQKMKKVLGDIGSVHPLVYLRRQDLFMDSLYREMLGWAGQRIVQGPQQFIEENHREWADFERRLEPWRECFGDDALIVRSYEDAVAATGLLGDVAQILGLNDVPPIKTTSRYRSFDRRDVNLLRAINKRPDISDSRKVLICDEIRQRTREEPDTGTLVNRQLLKELRATYADQNERLVRDLVTGPSAALSFPADPPHSGTVKQTQPWPRKSIEASTAQFPPDHCWESRRDWPFPQRTFWVRKTILAPLIAPIFGQRRQSRVGIHAIVPKNSKRIRSFVRHHLSSGVKRIVLVFEDPDDPAADAMERHPWVDVLRSTPELWQSALGHTPSTPQDQFEALWRVGREHLREVEVDWTIGLNTGQFIYGGVFSELASLDKDVSVLLLPAAEPLWEDNARSSIPRYFRVRSGVNGNNKAVSKEISEDISDYSRRGMVSGAMDGCFVRAEAEVSFCSGPIPMNFRSSFRHQTAQNGRLLQLSFLGYEEWKDIWVMRKNRAVQEASTDRVVRNQFELLSDQLSREDEEGLRDTFQRWYCPSPQTLECLLDSGLAFQGKLSIV